MTGALFFGFLLFLGGTMTQSFPSTLDGVPNDESVPAQQNVISSGFPNQKANPSAASNLYYQEPDQGVDNPSGVDEIAPTRQKRFIKSIKNLLRRIWRGKDKGAKAQKLNPDGTVAISEKKKNWLKRLWRKLKGKKKTKAVKQEMTEVKKAADAAGVQLPGEKPPVPPAQAAATAQTNRQGEGQGEKQEEGQEEGQGQGRRQGQGRNSDQNETQDSESTPARPQNVVDAALNGAKDVATNQLANGLSAVGLDPSHAQTVRVLADRFAPDGSTLARNAILAGSNTLPGGGLVGNLVADALLGSRNNRPSG